MVICDEDMRVLHIRIRINIFMRILGTKETYFVVPMTDVVICKFLNGLEAVFRNKGEYMIRLFRTIIFNGTVSFALKPIRTLFPYHFRP